MDLSRRSEDHDFEADRLAVLGQIGLQDLRFTSRPVDGKSGLSQCGKVQPPHSRSTVHVAARECPCRCPRACQLINRGESWHGDLQVVLGYGRLKPSPCRLDIPGRIFADRINNVRQPISVMDSTSRMCFRVPPKRQPRRQPIASRPPRILPRYRLCIWRQWHAINEQLSRSN
jgi:hypothetical protein